jgi:hypothetical protein
VKINSKTDLPIAVEFIRSCLIVHNLILEVEHTPEDTAEWEWVIEGLDDEAEGVVDTVESFEWDSEVWGDFNLSSPQEKCVRVQVTLFRDLFEV